MFSIITDLIKGNRGNLGVSLLSAKNTETIS